jgi:CRISPR system Cascade subunit CasB
MEISTKSRNERFVTHILEQLPTNRRLGACLRRADNPVTGYHAWEYLLSFGATLEKPREFQACALIAAALARDKPERDGECGLGRSLCGAYPEADNEPAKARLRRLLACASAEEVCDVLRPMLRLIAEKSRYPLSYARLLNDLCYYNERTRERWAQDFFAQLYGSKGRSGSGEEPS